VCRSKGKGKVVPFHTMNAYRGSRGKLHSFLTSASDGGEWLASRPRPLYPQEKTPIPIEQEVECAPEPVWTI
jgi:hypothetical protein